MPPRFIWRYRQTGGRLDKVEMVPSLSLSLFWRAIVQTRTNLSGDGTLLESEQDKVELALLRGKIMEISQLSPLYGFIYGASTVQQCSSLYPDLEMQATSKDLVFLYGKCITINYKRLKSSRQGSGKRMQHYCTNLITAGLR